MTCEKAKMLPVDLLKDTPGTSGENDSFKANRGDVITFKKAVAFRA